MNASILSSVICLALIFLPSSAPAQSRPNKPKAALDKTASGDQSIAKAEATRLRNERRSQARSLLISLASDARSFRDQPLRARCLARIADALWDVDAEQGRTLFRKSWEAAETADQNPAPYTLGQGPLNLRAEVLKLVARRDHRLAEEFLEKLKTDQKPADTGDPVLDLWELPAPLQERLRLALSLLRTGDMERALEFADPVIGSVTLSTVDFLSLLRERNPAAADRRYAAMLANTAGNLSADPNTISLLSSYIFTPRMYVLFSTDGGPSWSMPPSFSPPANVDARLRLAFFQTAAAVLLRPQLPTAPDPSRAGIAGKYMVVKRLMPLFEQFAPGEMTAAMRGQLEALSSLVGDSIRQGDSEWLKKGISPETQLADQENSLLDQIDHAKTSDERDQLYFKLALLALSKDDPKARDYVSKIDDIWFRDQARGWVDWGLSFRAIEKKRIELALEMVRIGELTHIQRVWLLTQSAKLLAKTNRDKALSLLDDATSEARRIEHVDLDRPRGLLAIANTLRLIEPSRAWDAVFDAVEAANSTESFTGEDGAVTQTITSKDAIMVSPNAVPDFDIEGIFGKLANVDYDRVVELARGYRGEAPRANATIAIARSVLNEKNAPAPPPQPATKD